MQDPYRMKLSQKKRIVIKIGSTSLTHPETGAVNLGKIEQLARQISDLKGRGQEVVLVTSGAVAAGKQVAEAMHAYMQSLPMPEPSPYANVPKVDAIEASVLSEQVIK